MKPRMITVAIMALGGQGGGVLQDWIVTLAEDAPANTVNPGGFRGGLISGWNSLVSVLNATVSGIGFVVPWLIPIGIVTGLGWWIVRRRRS